MATTNDVRVSLLASEAELAKRTAQVEAEEGEDIEVQFHLQDRKGKATSEQTLGLYQQHDLSLGNEGIVDIGAALGIELPGEEKKRKKKKLFSGSEMIVSVFVVAFDTKKGERRALCVCPHMSE